MQIAGKFLESSASILTFTCSIGLSLAHGHVLHWYVVHGRGLWGEKRAGGLGHPAPGADYPPPPPRTVNLRQPPRIAQGKYQARVRMKHARLNATFTLSLPCGLRN